jgi:abortive infection bacteriophage resistance protein
MKIFKTHNQQLQMLRTKGLVISNASRVKRILERENYYSVVNGYRTLFAVSTAPFRFITGTNFDEIYALYDLDRELRSVYLKNLLKIEKNLQSLSAYFFSADNSRNNRAYLDFRNFRVPPQNRSFPNSNEIHKTISMFSAKMANGYDEAIQHYITKHQEVPFWVLVNSLALGEIGFVYYFLKDNQRTSIAKYFSKQRRSEYGDPSINISPSDIDIFLFNAKHYRNSCAHNERFFCKQTSRIQNIKLLMDKMKSYLTKKDFTFFEKSVTKLFDESASKFHSISISSIKTKAGF